MIQQPLLEVLLVLLRGWVWEGCWWRGGGAWRLGHSHVGVRQDAGVGGVGVLEDVMLALVDLTASPMVGNLLEIMPRATQPC